MLPGGSTHHGREADSPVRPDLPADQPTNLWSANIYQGTTPAYHLPWQADYQQYTTLLQQHCLPLANSTADISSTTAGSELAPNSSPTATRASSTTTLLVCSTADASTLSSHTATTAVPETTAVSTTDYYTAVSTSVVNTNDEQVKIFNSDTESSAASQEAIIQEENVNVSYNSSTIPDSEILYDFEIRDYSNIKTNIANILQQVSELEELQKSLRKQIRNQENTIWEQEHQLHMLTRYQNITIEQQEKQISDLSQHNSDLQIQINDYKNQVAFLQTIMSHYKKST